MTTRLYANIVDTTSLLEAILAELNHDRRVMFLCDANRGRKVEQRLRVKLSRVRKSLIQKGRKRQHFKLVCSIHPWTENNKRYDCVVMWRTQDETHKAIELLEDLVGHGQPIL